ncbi:class I SAM-dependent methyltransferase [Luteolibacter marinus]|uniref:class I SAM-dependent methyltransferase n=1 Tax=Luteolibacter marinus TaxID=2776705 RepID=UPI0018682C88|nr:class I SAM-dependent methyltransferase [Luteolibacter marinus]
MEPADTGRRYDAIAKWWQENTHENYGMPGLERALRFAPAQGHALDVGCGSHGRFIRRLLAHGFEVHGVDISSRMIELARQRDPGATYHVADICDWTLPRPFDFISAWDSTFHLPLHSQEPVLQKLCAGLTPGGVLLFTCGGGDAGEISGSFQGHDFEYSTLGVEAFVRILDDCGCNCRHVEYDQYPENHVVIVAQRK